MRKSYLQSGFVGSSIGLLLVAIFYGGQRIFQLPFLPFDLFDWLARVLPGDLVTLGIDTVVDFILLANVGGSTSATAKLIEQIMALLLFIVSWGIGGLLIAALSKARSMTYQMAGLIVGALFSLGALAVTINLGSLNGMIDAAWIVLLLTGGGWAAGGIMAAWPDPQAQEEERRQFLLRFGGSILGLALGGWAIGRFLGRAATTSGSEQAVSQAGDAAIEMADVATDPALLQDRLMPAPGTRPELTPDGEFYRIDINTLPPSINEEDWQLQVSGLFDNPRNLTLADLMAFPAVTQPLTLSCISNRIGGDLISSAEWTGVRLGLVLDDLGLQPEAQELYIEAQDGFYESVSMTDMMDPRTLLVYAMNGETLPQRHGFPLRIYIPNRYGMKQPKWITRIEAIPGEGAGYWVDRGWSEEARPHIISIIDSVASDQRNENGDVPIGGIAWAGDRGIESVEVQVDDGPWQSADLRLPPLSTLTWVQWRYDWPAQSGAHTFRVRAVDGMGTLQVGEPSSVRPDGATGYHEVRHNIT